MHETSFLNTCHEEFPGFSFVCVAAILVAASKSLTILKYSCIFDKPCWSLYGLHCVTAYPLTTTCKFAPHTLPPFS